MNEPDSRYTLRWRGRQLGPYSMQQLNQKLDEHEIGMGHEICCEDQWITLEEFFARLKAEQAAAAPPAASNPPAFLTLATSPSNPSVGKPGQISTSAAESSAGPIMGGVEKAGAIRLSVTPAPLVMKRPALSTPPRHRLVYAFLGIFFGFLGVHNYYARHWLTGLLQLLLSIATFLLGFGVIAPWLWALAEAILVRKDGNGNEMI